MAAEVGDPASFVVPAHLFAQIVRNLGGKLAELELIGAELAVRASGSDFKLQSGNLPAYRELTFSATADATLDGAELARSLANVRYAASNEAFQAVFRGLKVERHASKVRVVASDGFQLALREFAVPGEPQSLISPARSADELVRVLGRGPVGLSFGDGQLGVTTDRVRMIVKLLDSEFPDYERVIPKDIKIRATLPAAQFKEVVSRMAVLADKNVNNRIEFILSEGTLRLNTEGDYGRAQDVLSVEPAMSLGFNAKYVLDAIGPVEGEVEMQFSGSTPPAMFKGSGGGGYLAIVVPHGTGSHRHHVESFDFTLRQHLGADGQTARSASHRTRTQRWTRMPEPHCA